MQKFRIDGFIDGEAANIEWEKGTSESARIGGSPMAATMLLLSACSGAGPGDFPIQGQEPEPEQAGSRLEDHQNAFSLARACFDHVERVTGDVPEAPALADDVIFPDSPKDSEGAGTPRTGRRTPPESGV